MYQLLALAAIADDVLDGHHRHVELFCDTAQLVATGHAVALPAADLAQDTSSAQTGEAGEVDGGFGMPGAAQHSTLLGDQNK